MFISKIRRIYEYRYFLNALVSKEFKVRYTQSALGMAWLLIEPLLTVLAFTAVFTLLGRKSANGVPYPLYFYSGLLFWNFFASCLSQGTKCFVSDRNLWGKLDFPRELVVIKGMAVYFVDLLLASVPFVPLLFVYGYLPHVQILWVFPLFFLVALFGSGLILLLGSMNVYLRDVGILTKTVTNLWFWLTPVIFDFPTVGFGRLLYYVNPMAGIVHSMRNAILLGLPPDFDLLISMFIAAPSMFVLGYSVFRRLQRGFADVV